MDNLDSNKTRSICGVCSSLVDAEIIEKEGRSYLRKLCSVCGPTDVKISNYHGFYSRLRDFYFKAVSKPSAQNRYILFFTPECNLKCPICYLRPHDDTIQKISVEEIESILKRKKCELILYGAEPTCSEDIFRVINLVSRYQKSVVLYTNGLRLQDYSYVCKLKDSGVSKIILQFDGFDDKAYEIIRGQKLLDIKMQVLDNLKKLDIPVVFDVTVMKGVNEEQVVPIFDYAVKNNFVRGITYLAYTISRKDSNFSADKNVLGDEIIDVLIKDTKGKIKREDIFVFQKLLYVMFSSLKKRVCLHSQHYLVMHSNAGYLAPSELLNFNKLDKILDKYIELKERKHSFLGFMYLCVSMLGILLNPILLIKLLRWIKIAFLFLVVKKDHHGIGRDFIELDFVTGCTPHQMDYRVTNNCVSGWIFKDKDGKLYIKNNCTSLLRKVWA